MGDIWDYKLRKMDIAWELASRVIPSDPEKIVGWTADNFVAKSQEVMKQAFEAVDSVFLDDRAAAVSGRSVRV